MGMDLIALNILRLATPFQRLRAKLGGLVFIKEDTRPGWSGNAPFYLFSCSRKNCINHTRLAIDYAHGFKNHNERVICPDCGTVKYFSIRLGLTIKQCVKMYKLINHHRPNKIIILTSNPNHPKKQITDGRK